MATINEVKQAFLDEYGHFANKTIKKLESGNFFHVDDRSMGDYDARKKLYPWFCTVDVTVAAGDKVYVHISQNVPKNPAVQAWWAENTVPGQHDIPRLELAPGDQHKLEDLAALIDAIIKRRYDVPSYKHVVPRTTDTLRRLKKVLDKIWA